MATSWEKAPILIVLPGGEIQKTLGVHYRDTIVEVIKDRPVLFDGFDTIMRKPLEEKPSVIVVPETVNVWDSGEFADLNTPIQQCDFVIREIRKHFGDIIPVVVIPDFEADERLYRLVTFAHLSVCHDTAYLGEECKTAIID